MQGPWRLLYCIALLCLALPVAHGQQATPTVVTLAGLRTVHHQGGFKAAAYLPDGTAVLLEDQGDGLHLLRADAGLGTILAEAQLGAAGDHGLALATDGLGNFYVGGTSSSGLLSGTPGAPFAAPADTTLNSFIAKFDSHLHLVFLSFLGAGRTALTGLAATHDAVFATGVTFSDTFPATPGTVLPHLADGNTGDGFIESFTADGARVRYATYLGGPGGMTSPAAIAADATGAVYVAGSTASAAYPAIAALQPTSFASESGFLSKLSADGSQFVFSTLIAGTGMSSLALDPVSGNLLLTGNLALGQFPVANALAPIAAVPYQSLLRVSPDGQDLRDSVLLLPGTASHVTPGLNGDAWVTGSLLVPLSSQQLLAGPGDSYALHLDAADIPDALIRTGGYPSNHPAFASLQSAPAPAALNLNGSAVLLPSTLAAETDPTFAGSQVFDLGLNRANDLLPGTVADILPAACASSLPCSGTGGLLLQLRSPSNQASLALSLGDAPNVLIRNLGPVTASGLSTVASTSSLTSDCPSSLPAGSQCGLVLGSSAPTSLTVSATNAEPLVAEVPATATAEPSPLLFSQPALDFGLVTAADSPATQTVTVTNLGTLSQTFASAPTNASANTPYSLAETASSCGGPASAHQLSAGASCTLTIGLFAATTSSSDGIVHTAWKLGTRDLPVTGYTQAASLTVSSAQIDFGNQLPGPSPLLRFLYLSNASLNAVSHSTVQTPAGSPFQVNDDCPSTLQPKSTCQIGFLYNQSSAPAFDSLSLSLDNGLTVLVTGQTTAPPLPSTSLPASSFLVTPATILFKTSEPVSSVSADIEVVQVTNTSAADVPLAAAVLGDFLLENTCPPFLAPQASCDLGLRFAPTQTGVREGLLTLSAASASQSITVPLSGTGTPLLDIAGAVDLGQTPVGEPVVQWFQLQGSTQEQLSALVSGDGFGVALLPDFGAGHGTVSSAAFTHQATAACLRCWVGVQFLSQTAGASTGLLTASTGTAGHASLTALSALALPATGLLITPGRQSFGAIPRHSRSAPISFVLTNELPGAVTAHLQQVAVSDGFVLTATSDPFGCSGSLAPSASCRVQVAFSPSAMGPLAGTLTIVTDVGAAVAQLAGTATSDPGLAIDPTFVSFGPETHRTVTLTNTGSAPQSLGPISASSAAFQATSQCATLPAGQSCTVDVAYLGGGSSGTLDLPVTSSPTVGQAATAIYAVPLDASAVTVSPALSLFPAQADFGVTPVGSLGPLRQFTLSNTSARALALTLQAPHNFPLTAPSGCSTLAAGATCTFTVVFLPETNGPLDGSLTVLAASLDGSSAGQATLYLQGYGLGSASLRLSAGTDPAQPLSFGTVTPGQTSTQSLTLTNGGTSALAIHRLGSTYPFQATSNCSLGLTPGASCQVNLTYLAPARSSSQAPQSDFGTLLVESDAQSGPDTVYLTGSVAPSNASAGGQAAALPVYTLAPSALTFPNTSAGQTSAPQDVLLSNPGTVPVSLAGLQAPPDFPATTDCTVLQPGSTCLVHVSFQPAAGAAALHTGTLALASDSTSPLDFISLLGASVLHPLAFSADLLQFGSVPLGTALRLSLQVTNGTILPVPLGQVTLTGNFTLGATTCPLGTGSLAAAQSCLLTITFQPLTVGEQAGQLTLASGALTQPLSASLSGEGVAGHLTVSPSALDFGTVDLAASVTASVLLTNSGKAPLSALGAVLSSPGSPHFLLGRPCSPGLAPGASCTLQVSFSPLQPGQDHALLTLSSSDPAGPTIIPVTGTGAQPPGFTFTVNSAAAADAQVQSGGNASFALAATPQGGYNTPLALTCTPVSPAPNATCTLSSSLLAIKDGPAQATVVLSTLSGLSAAAALPWGGLLLAWPWLARRSRSRRSRPVQWVLALGTAGAMAGLLSGCGNGPYGVRLPYTPPGAYTYQVSAAPVAGAIPPASVTLTLTVQ